LDTPWKEAWEDEDRPFGELNLGLPLAENADIRESAAEHEEMVRNYS